jgi:hypothetical protein
LQHALLSQDVFSVGHQRYTWTDVLLAAKLWGDWAKLERDVRCGIACLKRLEDTGEKLASAAVQATAREFCDARHLITAEEAEAWLGLRHLTRKMCFDYFRRLLLRQQWAAQLAEILAHYPVTDAEVERDIIPEGICSGRFAIFAQRLAARAAVYEKAVPLPATGTYPVKGLHSTRHAIAYDPRGSPSPGLPPEPCHEQMKTFARLEIVFQRFCQQAVARKALQEHISTHYLDWIRLDCRYVVLPAEGMAREAALRVREDGMELTAVATQAKTALYRARYYLDQLEPAVKPHFLDAKKGELLGPLRWGREFALFWILDKVMPSIDDPDIRRRAEQHVLQRLIDDEINKRVQWHGRW